MKLLLIATGGAAGTVLRYLIAVYFNRPQPGFPTATFIVNVVGCAVIGLAYGLMERGAIMNPEWRLFLTVGLCGGFTTFSAFALENAALLQNGQYAMFALYTALSVVLSIAAVFAGLWLSRSLA